MNKRIMTRLSFAIVVALPIAIGMASCESRAPRADGKNVSTAPNDTVNKKNIQPTESGYADINGLKMYFEVYGNG